MSDLDTTTFNTPNGYVITTFNTLPSPPETLPQDVAVSVVIRSDNRIIMGGYSQYTTDSYITLSCYNTDGSLYLGFGGGTGKVLQPVTPLGLTGCIVNDVILQANNYIIVTGNTSSPDPLPFFRPSMFVARFTDTGNLDTTFNSPAGYVIIPPSAFDSGVNVFDQCYSNSVIIQPSDGYIVLGGGVRLQALPNNKNFIALVRLTTTGALDNPFGTNGNGTVYAAFNLLTNNEDFCNCLSIQTDGKIVSGGVNSPAPSPAANSNLSVVRFTTGGILDTTFNSSGITQGWLIIIPNLPIYNYNFSSGLGINSVGQIIISSYITKTSGEQCFGLAAVTSSGLFPGTLDASFGTGGQTVLDLSPTYNLTGPLFSSCANALALQSDNKIVITGGFLNTSTFTEGFSLARFDMNGALDLTFGVAGLGYILSDLVSPSTEIGYSVAIQTDGKVLVGGTEVNIEDSGANNSFILARYFYTPIPAPPVPIAPICFPAGTPVLTDQGYIEIDKIEPSNNTINGRPIIAVTKTITPYDKLVCFERGSLGYNIPNRTTCISTDHCIIYRNKLIEAHKFVNRRRRIYYIKYNGKYLYNILMNRHYCMTVNNIKVETLNPKNIIAKLYTNDYNADYKIELINRINKHYLHKAHQSEFKENVYKNMMLNYTRSKNQRYRIHRYNPLIDYTSFFTRKRSSNDQRYPIVNVALQNATNTTTVVDKELIQHIPQKINEPVLVEPKAVESEAVESKTVESKTVKPHITKSKIKIDIIGKNKVTLKRIVGANNKLRICSHKYVGNKHK
jgi:uncharacterized delta-60 repeat protein